MLLAGGVSLGMFHLLSCSVFSFFYSNQRGVQMIFLFLDFLVYIFRQMDQQVIGRRVGGPFLRL
jgi:hypothetical protein